MITSTSNAQVKMVVQLNQKAKVRREAGLFAAEGRKMFFEAPSSWVNKVYLSESVQDDRQIREKLEQEGLSYEIVSDPVFRQMSDTKSPQGVLTLLNTPHYEEKDLFQKEDPLIMILEDLQDPGNAGTILRTAEGAGVDGIILTKTSVDITNPKVIRSTMGSIYRMPFFYTESVVSLKQTLERQRIRMFAAHLHGRNAYDREDYRRGTAFVIGNEGNGLTDEAAKCCDTLIRIPMCGQVESLNAAMASGILMYEAFRQRRKGE